MPEMSGPFFYGVDRVPMLPPPGDGAWDSGLRTTHLIGPAFAMALIHLLIRRKG